MSNNLKVLIIGHSFNKINGTGITLSNLFSNWEQKTIYIAADKVNIERSNFSIIDNIYRLGQSEISIRFPFNLIFKQAPSGKLTHHQSNSITNGNLILSKGNVIYKFFEHVYFNFGLNLISTRMRLSKPFLEWIREINPDLVYSLLGKYELLCFIEELTNIINKPLILHTMDDWPKSLPRGVLKNYYYKTINSKLNNLFAKSSLNLGISEGMAIEYKRRYKVKFDYFHNPIDLSKWITKKDIKPKNNVVKLLYAGRINYNHIDSIEDICKCIKPLINKINKEVVFDIYSSDSNSAVVEELKKYSGVCIYPYLEHRAMPDLIIKYDLLILPLDFSEFAIDYACLSLPTKLSEYMITGVPILVYASNKMELIKHLETRFWGFAVTERDSKKLLIGLIDAITNNEERSLKSINAVNYARKNYDIKIISQRFQKLLEATVSA